MSETPSVPASPTWAAVLSVMSIHTVGDAGSAGCTPGPSTNTVSLSSASPRRPQASGPRLGQWEVPSPSSQWILKATTSTEMGRVEATRAVIRSVSYTGTAELTLVQHVLRSRLLLELSLFLNF